MNIAISKQKLTFILTGYRDVLRISLFADYEQIFNEGLQPQGKLNIISFACKVALWSDPSVTADALEKTYQSKHISELKRGFVNKLNLIKRSYFLPRNSLLDLYFKVILPSVRYALPIWGCCTNKNEFNSLKSIHCRAARVIYNLPRDMPSGDIRKTANWDSLFDTYKVKIATLIYNIYNGITPSCLEHIIQRKEHKYDLRHTTYDLRTTFWNFIWKTLFLVEDPLFRIFYNHPLSAPGTTPRRQKSLMPSGTWTLMKSHRKWTVPKLTGISPFIDHIHIFYCTYSTFYWLHSVLKILIFYFYLWLISFTRPHKLYKL